MANAGRPLGGIAFVALAARLFVRKDRADAKRLFGFSILYLFALFAALLVEHLVGLKPLTLASLVLGR